MKLSQGIIPVAIKEIRHIWRDKLSMLILFALPALIVGLFGFVLSFEIREIHVAVLNEDRDAPAATLIQKIHVSESFQVIKQLSHSGEITAAFAENDIRMVIVIPKEFSASLKSKDTPAVHLFIDASDPMAAAVMETSMNHLTKDFLLRTLPGAPAGVHSIPPVIHFLYNPSLKKEVMPIPGLILMIFILISSIMLSISINREEEQGTGQWLVLTPLRTGSLLLGKSIPYFFIAVVHIASVWMVSRYLFEVRVNGNPLLFFSLCLLFALNAMTFGLMIAAWVSRQLEALVLCWLFLFIPNVFLSGFIFPVLTMPPFLQGIAGLMPGTSFMDAYRGIVFRGSGLYENSGSFILLILQGCVVLWIASKGFACKYSKR
jgi:ABC-2 type transport system permease protein